MEEEKKRKLFRKIEILLFTAYLAVLCYFLFFADSMGRTYSERTYHYNLIPFKEITRFWVYRHSLDFWSVMINLVGNVVVFLPVGAFLPGLFAGCRKIFLTVLLSFEFSLTVEMIQLVCKVGCFDVDDIILNTLGGFLGYLLYWILRWAWRKKNEEKKK